MDDVKAQIRARIQELQTALRVIESLEGAPKSKPRTLLAEAFDVLKEAKRPLRFLEILQLMQAKGLDVKEQSLRSALKQDGHKVGIERAGRGLWWIRTAAGTPALTEALAMFKGEDDSS